jgi:hypothetical protein
VPDDVNTVGENIGTLNKITQALLDASKEAGLEVTPEKTMYMLMPSYKKAGQKHGIKRANMSFEDVANFKYLGTTLTDQIWGMLATVQFRVLCLPTYCLAMYTEPLFCHLFCMGVKLGLSH